MNEYNLNEYISHIVHIGAVDSRGKSSVDQLMTVGVDTVTSFVHETKHKKLTSRRVLEMPFPMRRREEKHVGDDYDVFPSWFESEREVFLWRT